MSGLENSNRIMNGLGAVVCGSSLLIAIFYMERVLHLPPCPLCVLSRYVVAVMLLIFLIGLVDNAKYIRQYVYTVINIVFVIVGLVIAGRHLWIQNNPSLTCSLGPASNSLIKFITHAFAGSSDCAVKSWEFLGLSIPEQTLFLFGGLLIFLLYQLYFSLKYHRGAPLA